MTESPSTAAAEIAALLRSFMDAVTFTPGGGPTYASIRNLMIPGGLFIKNSGDVPEISTVDEFITPRQRQVDDGVLTEFSEIELNGNTDLFGRIAQRLSTYRKAGVSDGVAFGADGVISTQFVLTRDGWRISSMAWDDERPGLSLDDLVVGQQRAK